MNVMNTLIGQQSLNKIFMKIPKSR